jgi:tetratricopeptide (TPR) repeat protein
MRHALIIALLILGGMAEPAAAVVPAEHSRLLATADSLWSAAARDSSATLLDRALPTARVQRDTTFLLELLIRRGGQLVSFGHFATAEPLLREAMVMAQARVDSARLCWALRWLGPAVGDVGDVQQAEPLYLRQLALARALGRAGFEGWAHCGLGWCADRRGQFADAIVQYEAATGTFERSGDRSARAFALNALGTVLQADAQYARAERAYRDAAAAARELRYAMVEGLALNNLATLELSMGDPGEALGHFRQAYEIHVGIGHSREALVPLLNVAECEAQLGQLAGAAATLTEVVDLAAKNDYRDLRALARSQLAGVLQQQGHPNAALRMLRESANDSASLNPSERIEMLIRLAEVFASQDSVGAALATLQEGARLAGDDLRDLPTLELRCRLGQLLTDQGRAAESLPLLLAVEAEAHRADLDLYRIEALASAAGALDLLHQPDRAHALLEQAAAVWEDVRDVPLDPQWREQRGTTGRLIYTSLAGKIIGEERPCSGVRAEAAFVRLQAFKARTLHERMVGPGRVVDGAWVPFDLGRFRRETLRPGELFLDAYLGPQMSWLFAVTRDSLRAIPIPPADELVIALRFQRALHLAVTEGHDDAADRAALSTAASSLSERLLAAGADLVASSERIIFAPDDALNMLPLAGLPLAEVGSGEPLLARLECTVVPSATVLAMLRRAGEVPAISPAGGFRLLAIYGGEDAAGNRLRGAERESRRLRGRYVGVELCELGPSRQVPMTLADLQPYDGLHFAMHTQAEDQAPWRSALGFTTGPDSSVVTAADIAGGHLAARLAVLSGCATAGGRTLSGEGVLGLTSAFLAAGVPAVVATLWPVDDRTTADLMDRFYAELSAGHTAAAALRTAQLAIRAQERRSHPFYWAGFVLVGDGDVTLPLQSRNATTPVFFVAGAVVFVIAVVAGARLRSRRRHDV